MKYTSAEANKLLRRLNEEYEMLLQKEEQSKTFLASLGEDPESVRPAYDYSETQNTIDNLEKQIRNIKHRLNIFNTTTVIPEFNITVDEMLVLIPQLNKRKAKLSDMMSKLPKSREENYASRNNIIDYRYINYDLNTVEEDYKKVTETLSSAQTALDKVNSTLTIEI